VFAGIGMERNFRHEVMGEQKSRLPLWRPLGAEDIS
jgi:hypothetical protein